MTASSCIYTHAIINGTPSRPPHFHAIYAEYEALIDIRTLEVLRGELPNKQLKRVLDWAAGKQEVLMNEFICLQKRA